MSNSGIPVISDVAKAVGHTVDVAVTTVSTVLKNPLPVITSVALTAALGPAGLAIASTSAGAATLSAAVIATAQGKNIGDIAKSALLAYGAGSFADITGSGDITQMLGEKLGGAAGTILENGLNQAFFNSTVAALGGFISR